jgi:hypothetical protein
MLDRIEEIKADIENATIDLRSGEFKDITIKYFDPKFIKQYIEDHKADISSVYCSFREDEIVDLIYSRKRGYVVSLDGEEIDCCVPSCSNWATPIMLVFPKKGRKCIKVECFYEKVEQQDIKESINMKKAELFAAVVVSALGGK